MSMMAAMNPAVNLLFSRGKSLLEGAATEVVVTTMALAGGTAQVVAGDPEH